MNMARDKILAEIKTATSSNRQPFTYQVAGISYADKTRSFIQGVEANGGSVFQTKDKTAIENFIHAERDAGKNIQYITSGQKLDCSLETLYHIDTAVITGGTAVAENGAVWVSEKDMGHRLLPFSCKQLVLIVEEKNIVHNLHEAYAAINVADTNYGVFIAGPSKTADIEQSLVIGAHGPLNHFVFIINQ